MIPVNFSLGKGGEGIPTLPVGVFDPRCEGTDCPSRKYCDRCTSTTRIGAYAPLYQRREAGDTACKLFVANRPMSTFEGVHRD